MHAFSLQLMHGQAAGSRLRCLGRIRDARALLRVAAGILLPSLQASPRLRK